MCDASKCFLSSNFLSNNDFSPGSVFDDACVALFLIQFWYNVGDIRQQYLCYNDPRYDSKFSGAW